MSDKTGKVNENNKNESIDKKIKSIYERIAKRKKNNEKLVMDLSLLLEEINNMIICSSTDKFTLNTTKKYFFALIDTRIWDGHNWCGKAISKRNCRFKVITGDLYVVCLDTYFLASLEDEMSEKYTVKEFIANVRYMNIPEVLATIEELISILAEIKTFDDYINVFEELLNVIKKYT